MKQVMYGIEIADVNDFGGWVGYEPVKEEVAKTLNHHMYLFFQNEQMCIRDRFMERAQDGRLLSATV